MEEEEEELRSGPGDSLVLSSRKIILANGIEEELAWADQCVRAAHKSLKEKDTTAASFFLRRAKGHLRTAAALSGQEVTCEVPAATDTA